MSIGGPNVPVQLWFKGTCESNSTVENSASNIRLLLHLSEWLNKRKSMSKSSYMASTSPGRERKKGRSSSGHRRSGMPTVWTLLHLCLFYMSSKRAMRPVIIDCIWRTSLRGATSSFTLLTLSSSAAVQSRSFCMSCLTMFDSSFTPLISLVSVLIEVKRKREVGL